MEIFLSKQTKMTGVIRKQLWSNFAGFLMNLNHLNNLNRQQYEVLATLRVLMHMKTLWANI